MKKVLITQSNYIPWKGYFDNINQVDTFVIYDDMQYTRRDWRNRNYIKTPNGLKWITIPVEVKGKYFQKINETRISDKAWNINHLNQLKSHYNRSPFFNELFPWVESVYESATHDYLTEINVHFLKSICDFLEIKTTFVDSREFELKEGKTERLVSICKALSADEYLTGPAAKSYMDESCFEQEGIKVIYADYSNYPEYPQPYPPFVHGVCIWDILFNCGKDSAYFLIKK